MLGSAHTAMAQAGPPFLTNDPGTPGNANWEINLASMQTIIRGTAAYQLPQVDLNFGIGDRIQLTYEVPYILQSQHGEALQSGWGNGYPGIKWRFLDEGENGWQLSMFPQVETAGSALARHEGIAESGPRYLLPIEAARKLGPIDVDVEVGYYVAGHGPRERIIGLAVDRPVSARLELDAEIYDDRAQHAAPQSTTMDGVCGGPNGSGVVFRYSLANPGVVATVHAFSALDASGDNQDGANPYARLTRTGDGSLYSTASYGGTFGNGVVYRVRPDGRYEVLHTFSAVDATTGANVDGAAPDYGVIFDGCDSMIGMTDYGGYGSTAGATGNGTLYQLQLHR